jgi:hypothetical protein
MNKMVSLLLVVVCLTRKPNEKHIEKYYIKCWFFNKIKKFCIKVIKL